LILLALDVKKQEAQGVAPSTITKYFGSQQPYKNYDPMQIHFIENVMLFVAKGYEALSTLECPWLYHLVMNKMVKFVSLFRNNL
jgi:hypothetical protein